MPLGATLLFGLKVKKPNCAAFVVRKAYLSGQTAHLVGCPTMLRPNVLQVLSSVFLAIHMSAAVVICERLSRTFGKEWESTRSLANK